jgi:hypothetical protein
MVDASSIQGDNVLFNKGEQSGDTVSGFTNSTPQVGVNIRSGGATIRASGGQARVTGDLNEDTNSPEDTVNLTQFQLELANGGTFNDLELRLAGGNANRASFTLIDDGGMVFNFNDQVISGDGRFGFRGIDGQSIASVSFTVNRAGIQDVRQIRLSALGTTPGNPDAVPEPATWAMMLGGFGLLGGAMRRRRSQTQVTYA